MNKKNSLLLPPQFFETDSDEKIRNILDLDVDALYLFDHFKNPTDSSKPTYIFTEEIFSLYKKVNNEIEVGVCVLNVNARDSNILFKDIIDPLLELKNINIGLGTGDNKYEKHDEIFNNDIDEIITYILKNLQIRIFYNEYSLIIKFIHLFISNTSWKSPNRVN